MALTFDYKECDQELLTDEHYERWTEYVVFNSMFVGMPHITQQNYSLFVMRVMQFNAATNSGIKDAWELTKAVLPYVGLRTNASPMTDAAFAKELKRRSEYTMQQIRTSITETIIKEIEEAKCSV